MNTWTAIIVGLVALTYALDTVAELLNLRNFSAQPPEEFRSLSTPESHARAGAYLRDNVRFDLVRRTVSVAAFLVFWFAGGFEWSDGLARAAGFGPVVTGLLFAGILLVAKSLLQIPFSVYDTFVIEQRYGFNRTTPRTFGSDLVKGVVLTALIGAPAFALLVSFFDRAGELGWLYAWLIFTVLQLGLAYLAPILIMPLFNRFTPLPEGELKQAIEAYVRRQEFVISGIYTMDGSRRSSKANAFFTGFGRFRRLVLFDTLLTSHTTDELVAVFAHEVGHFKRGHIPKFILVSLGSSLLMFWVFSRLLGNPELFAAFRMSEISTYASLIFVSLLLSPALRLLSILPNLMSRKFEFEADEFSSRTFGRPDALATALKKLSQENLSHLTPHPLKVALDYSHPPVLQRISRLREAGPGTGLPGAAGSATQAR